MPDLTRFIFCPLDHCHITAKDAANCSELVAAFGELKPVKRVIGRVKCAELDCPSNKVFDSKYCAIHRRAHLKNNRNRRGSMTSGSL